MVSIKEPYRYPKGDEKGGRRGAKPIERYDRYRR